MDISFFILIVAVLALVAIIYIILNYKNKKILSINGAVLTEEELEKYALALATDHTVTYNSSLKTYPYDRLINNFKIITYVYNILNSHVTMRNKYSSCGRVAFR